LSARHVILKGQPDSVQHEPSRLLRDAEITVEFPGRNSVLAVHDHPGSRKPLLQRDRGVFKDGSRLQAEAGFRMVTVAFPDAWLRQPRHFFRTAFRALHLAVGPSQLSHKLFAMFKIREIQDRVPKYCFGVVSHDFIMSRKAWFLHQPSDGE